LKTETNAYLHLISKARLKKKKKKRGLITVAEFLDLTKSQRFRIEFLRKQSLRE
jgi:hypothetical protein